MNSAWLRAPDDEMWRLHITMLEHAGRLARAQARVNIGIASGLRPSTLIFQADIGRSDRKASSSGVTPGRGGNSAARAS